MRCHMPEARLRGLCCLPSHHLTRAKPLPLLLHSLLSVCCDTDVRSASKFVISFPHHVSLPSLIQLGLPTELVARPLDRWTGSSTPHPSLTIF
ncbi:hypothetical protein AUEXF2481DRAFT_36020 [Aureobasidium subglaciale EXF-2481]|uniref:Uncharacterized protein n=1 Tax=Aureobasidium subglaciale (strain EXF-2481) TaxID=1043005 RepID=A0A074YX11_AURSE|nr:uncharacterized protein AUEXF2481DRAFT_36020 [Aureobasidium subglaciale EXF-2481]KEQ98707.1 hypothetical protein AUEXF2481DRAFT_36020 [Aureobasidium subglaciale EXF-2481]